MAFKILNVDPPQVLSQRVIQYPVRVCHVSMTLQTGGLERLLVEFGKFRNSKQVSMCFVSLGELGQPAEELRAAGYEVHSLKMPQTSKKQAIIELRNFLRERQINVVHTHNTYPHFYGAIAARWAGVSTVINTQHGRGCGPNWKSRVQFFLANCLTTRIVGVSEDATALCKKQDRIAASRMQTIWNGIDLERFAFKGPQPHPIAISVARLSPEKDYETLLRAIPQVVEYEPKFKLVLIGDGVERDRLQKLSRELQIDHCVDFLGERKAVQDLLGVAGFFVSSSRTEGISLTLLEAMAVGLPIVTTAVGGSPEIVVEGQTGKLVPPQDPAALASAMCDMLDERPLWQLKGDAARKRVERFFNARKMVSDYENLYRECVFKQVEV